MRPIKFRFWDGKHMEYEPGDEPGDLQVTLINKVFTEGVWMQFTGLLDKNGKEIWEGDVVNALLSGFLDENFVSVIEVQNGCFGIRSIEDGILVEGKGKFKSFDGCDTTKRIEVIGNIYENPELLK